MSDLLNALRKAVVTAELDLGEFDAVYAGAKLPYRINWTRGQRKERARLLTELADIIERQQRYLTTEPKETLAEKLAETEADGERNQADWLGWWAGVLLITPAEVEKLQSAMSRPHWRWMANQIVGRQADYEAAETKKADGEPFLISEEKATNPPNSTKESG